MKHYILFIVCMLVAVAATAQTGTPVSEERLTYSKKTFYLDGNPIAKSQLENVLGNDLYKSYKKAKGLRTAGVVCTSVGGVAFVGGVAGMISAELSDSCSDIFVGGVLGTSCALVGAAVTIPGIIMWCMGNHKIKQIPIAYNSGNRSTAYLSPASSGIGVSLNF